MESILFNIERFHKIPVGRILAKLDYLNPGFSKKDRIARQIIEDAETEGRLIPGQTVVELTSGNTGTGLAIVCGIKKISLCGSHVQREFRGKIAHDVRARD